MKKFFAQVFLAAALILVSLGSSRAQDWEKQGDYYLLTKNNRKFFRAPGAGPNKFAAKYLKYNAVPFLAGAPGERKDYGRLDLEGNNLFSVPLRAGTQVEELHLLAGGNYSNSYEHDKLMHLFGDKYFYATLTAIFVYQDGVYQEQSVPIWWDWFHLGKGEWSAGGAKVKSLGDNPVRKDCSLFHIVFTNPRGKEPVKNILITDSWVGDRPFSDVFALTLKSVDSPE